LAFFWSRCRALVAEENLILMAVFGHLQRLAPGLRPGLAGGFQAGRRIFIASSVELISASRQVY